MSSLSICCLHSGRQQCTAALLLAECISHSSELLTNGALQHCFWQSASLTHQSCCADNRVKAGSCLCNVRFKHLLLAQWPATVLCSTASGRVHLSLIRVAVQITVGQQAHVSAMSSVSICCLHSDRQQCIAALLLAECISHSSELLCRQQTESRLMSLQC